MGSGRSVEVVQKEIEGLFAELAELDATALTDGEVADYAMRAQRIRSLADAHCARSAGRVDATKVWAADGARSATAWLAWRCNVARGRASAAVVAGRELRAMPGVEAAIARGQLTADHARLLALARAEAPEAFARDEAELVEAAGELRFSVFEKRLRYWRLYHAPDAEDERARRRREGRRLHCSRSFEDTVVLDGLLDPIGGAIVKRELERLERELFDADLAEARERCGDGFSLGDLRRTPAQRRADALVEMAKRSAARAPGAVAARPLIQVLAGTEALQRMCELSDGTVVTPGEVLPLLSWADLERIVFDGPSKVLDVGVRQRLFRGATRTAVEARDLTCTHESCDVPAERCEIDHKVPYGRGGLTTQANGWCRCKYHHRPTRPPA